MFEKLPNLILVIILEILILLGIDSNIKSIIIYGFICALINVTLFHALLHDYRVYKYFNTFLGEKDESKSS